MNVDTLDFGELLNDQKENPQMTKTDKDSIKEDSNSNVELSEDSYELYPVGTVVMLKSGKKRLMIIGFYPLNEDKTGKLYDYIGCLFPEGILGADKLAMFNHDQIKKVYIEGLRDEEEKEFKERLRDFFDSL